MSSFILIDEKPSPLLYGNPEGICLAEGEQWFADEDIQPEADMLPDEEGKFLLELIRDLDHNLGLTPSIEKWVSNCVHTYPGEYCRPMTANILDFASDLTLLQAAGSAYPDETGREILINFRLENYSFLPPDLVLSLGECLYDNATEECIAALWWPLQYYLGGENPLIYI